jgi:tetratricopeptide (TPR) repeat protein
VPEEPVPTDTFRAGPPGDGDDLTAAVAQARELDRSGHPDARGAWERVRAAAGDADLDDLLAGELAQAEGLARGEDGSWAAAVSGLHAAAARFEQAGRPGRAAAAAAQAAWASTQPDPDADVWPELDAQLNRVRELLTAGQAEPGDLLAVRHARGAVAALAVQRSIAEPGSAESDPGRPAPGPSDPGATSLDQPGPGAARPGQPGPGQPGPGAELSARLDGEARGLLADARTYGNLPREAAAMSLLAFAASVAGQLADEAAGLSRMVELLDEAGRPWATAAAVTRLGELALRQGQPAEAVARLERAVAAGVQWPPRGGPAAAAPLLLAHARAALGATLVAAGRGQEAVTVLAEAIPALGETDFAARARVDLGHAFRQAGDPRSAAEQFALASVGFSAGPDQQAHLLVSIEAARAFAEATMWMEALRAYDYARRLGTELGQWAEVVRIHRELAHMCVRQHGDDGLTNALIQFDQALTAAGQAAGPDGGAGADHAGQDSASQPGAGAGGAGAGAGADVIHERGIASYEAAQMLAYLEHREEALVWLGRAIADLSADDGDIETLADAAYFAADIEGNRLGRGEQARQRLAPVIERCARLDRAESLSALSELSAQLAG